MQMLPPTVAVFQILNEARKARQHWLISGADEIRKSLGLSESDFRFLGRAHNSRGRRHYIYSILDEVEQVAFALKLSHESMSKAPTGIPDDELGRRLTRNTFSVVQREQALHIRRLTEILVDLINFSQTNSNPYYDHYLLYEELVIHQHRRHDKRGPGFVSNSAIPQLRGSFRVARHSL